MDYTLNQRLIVLLQNSQMSDLALDVAILTT